MNNNVFIIPIKDQFLLHAPLHGLTATMNSSSASYLRQNIPVDPAHPLFEIQKDLLLSKDPPLPKQGEFDPGFLGFITTRTCNLSCAYCGFGASTAPKKRIELETAVAAVDWMVETIIKNKRRILPIHFFGGEPFVAWDVVEVVVHRARMMAAKYNLIPHFEVSTNGVLPEKRLRFVGDYFDVVVLSFDGFKEFHDHNRAMTKTKGSFELVKKTAMLWSEMPVKLCLRVCVTQESVSYVEEIAKWYCEAFKPDIINFDTLQAWPKSMAAGLYTPDPLIFAKQYIRAKKLAQSYGIEVVYAADYTPAPRNSFCPVGTDTVMVSPWGRLNGCYLVEKDWEARNLNMNLGQVSQKNQFTINKDSIDRLRNLVTQKPACNTCFCKWSCAGGCHVNHSYPEADLDPDFCTQTRIITVCSILLEMGEDELVNSILMDKETMKMIASQKTNFPEIMPV